MKFLLRWAWPFLTLAVLFEYFSYQLFSGVPRIGFVGNLFYSLGVFIGDLPVIAIVAIVVAAIFWVASRIFSARSAAVSVALGCIATAIIIRPLLTVYFSN